MSALEELAGKLTPAQRRLVLSFRVEPKQMGIGLMQHLPGLVAPNDINHPIFGPHYHLTPLGKALAAHLQDNPHD